MVSIGLDHPCERTLYRAVAILNWCEETLDCAEGKVADDMNTIKDFANTITRPDIAIVAGYPASASLLDTEFCKSVYGDTVPVDLTIPELDTINNNARMRGTRTGTPSSDRVAAVRSTQSSPSAPHYTSRSVCSTPHARSTRDASVQCNDTHDTVPLTDDVLPSLRGFPQPHSWPIHVDADDASDDGLHLHDGMDEDVLEMEGKLLDAAKKVKLAVIKRPAGAIIKRPSASGAGHVKIVIDAKGSVCMRDVISKVKIDAANAKLKFTRNACHSRGYTTAMKRAIAAGYPEAATKTYATDIAQVCVRHWDALHRP